MLKESMKCSLWVVVNDCRSRVDDVFCYDSSILPTMNKSSRNLVPDIKIAVHPWHWAPLSVVSMMVSVWHSRTLEGSTLDLFPLKFGNAPQTSP